jgi:hypothetical protein
VPGNVTVTAGTTAVGGSKALGTLGTTTEFYDERNDIGPPGGRTFERAVEASVPRLLDEITQALHRLS